MGELKRLIKPGGTLLIATPDVDVWALQGMAGLQKDHIKELTQKEFIDIVSRNGFVVEGVYGQRIAKQGVNTFRKILNFIKKLDIFHLRNIVRGFVDKVDTATQPVSLDYEVRPIKAGTEKASVTVLVCRS